MSTPDLSPLAKLYLEHLPHIMAGYDALGADIPAVLRAVAARPGDGDAEADDKRIKRVWESGGMKLVLRLRWDKDLPVAELTLSGRSEDQPDYAKFVFNREFFDSQVPQSVVPRNLYENAYAECCRVWDLGVAKCEEVVTSRDWATRVAGVELMPEIAEELAKRLIDEGLSTRQANAVLKLRANKYWPIHGLWVDVRPSDGKEVQWCVTFDPAYSCEGRSEAAFLGLVAYPGKLTGTQLATVAACTWQYRGCAVLVDASALLQGTIQGSYDKSELVSTFVAKAVAQYLAARPLVVN